jgi:hypothetical protein
MTVRSYDLEGLCVRGARPKACWCQDEPPIACEKTRIRSLIDFVGSPPKCIE